jgi:hypothetical protein
MVHSCRSSKAEQDNNEGALHQATAAAAAEPADLQFMVRFYQ